MKTEQQIKLMSDMQILFAKMYSIEMSARIKRGIAEKKKALPVKKSKV
jgi:DNA invertase Pin-like site-specific DNA recombinase